MNQISANMPKPLLAIIACLLAVGLAGCSQHGTSELLNDSASVQTARANPDLSMPPDLRLPQPGSAPDVAAAPAAPVKRPAYAAATSPVTGAAPAQPRGDLYDQYGISKLHADGTPKTADELKNELRTAMLARKQQQNPNYGTIFNIGNVFKDG